MRAILRWMSGLIAAGLLLVPAAALSQSTSDPQAKSPPSDTVGPSELQNFSLSGSPTKPSDQPATVPAPEATPDVNLPSQTAQSASTRTRRAAVQQQTLKEKRPEVSSRAVAQASRSAPPITAPADALTIPKMSPLTSSVSGPVSTGSSPAVSLTPAQTLAPEHKLSVLPWLVAALVLFFGMLFLLWRRRQQEVFAGVPQLNMFVPPEPAPAPPPPQAAPRAAIPQPAPVPPKPSLPGRGGIVSSRLRPALEIGVQLLRCLIQEDRLVLEFELELFNAGAAPARAVLAEASLFNAGTEQEQELAAFFGKPVAAGEPIEAIPPMKRMSFVNQVVAPRSAIHEYELGGRKALVPILAFNALYRWSGGQAQTSAAFLVGRETNGDKLGPFSVERLPREFRSLAALPLPTALRT